MGLTLDINRFEKDLKEGELADFLDDLVRFGLLPPSVPGQAQAVLRGWRPIGGANNTVPGRIELGFALDAQAMARLYRRSDRINRNLPPAVQAEIAGICVTALKKAGVFSQKTLDDGLSLARALVLGEPTTADAATQLLYIATYRGFWDGPRPGESGQVRGAYEAIVEHFGGEGLDGRRRKGKLLPLLDALDALGDLALASPLPPDNWREADYLAAMRRVSEGVAGWLGSNRNLFKLDDNIRPQLIAFMLVVRSLAQLPQSPAASALPVAPLYLVLSRGPKGDEDRTVII